MHDCFVCSVLILFFKLSISDQSGNIVAKGFFPTFSLARRPIYPGRRPRNRQYQREQMASDEGNTSEYSNPPSSKSSTLESNPDRLRSLPLKRTSECSDGGSSDSDSEENITIATQVCYGESVAWALIRFDERSLVQMSAHSLISAHFYIYERSLGGQARSCIFEPRVSSFLSGVCFTHEHSRAMVSSEWKYPTF